MSPNSNLYQSEKNRWQAVCARDGRAVGYFWFAVATTGVFCRPNCGAKRALRVNVTFYDTIQAAITAGYRPCKRCRPDKTERSIQIVADVCRLIRESEEIPPLKQLAKAVAMSPFHLNRLFKAKTGMTPKAYATEIRGRQVRENLSKDGTVTSALYDAGFNASSRFYEQAKNLLGMSPSDYKNGGIDQKIIYGTCSCSLGVLLVAATEYGLCWISLGDGEQEVKQELHARFPNANLGQSTEFEALLTRVRDLVEGKISDSSTLPLDIIGTAFQYQVWQILMEIPPGETATYKDLAERLGKPGASRAVARACATNPVAVVIPCHRVIRGDGDLAGYRWGIERKRELLKLENKNSR